MTTFKTFAKTFLAFLFTLMLSSVAGFALATPAHADEGEANEATVKIASFHRGVVNDLRSSELLVAQVEGYDGNTSKLTYTWENTSLRTYLYAYGTADMDKAWEKPELEKQIAPRWGETGPAKSYTGEGFQWAAVQGADLGSHDLEGSITVTVKDSSGKLIGKGSYGPFQKPNLQADLGSTAVGIFKGDRLDLKVMAAQQSITHISCPACNVLVELPPGCGVAALIYGDHDNPYFILGTAEGSSSIKITATKGLCKFHANQSAESQCCLTVFAKPRVFAALRTEIYLAEETLRDSYEYSIDGQHWVKGKAASRFAGLTPNTEYQIYVRAPYQQPSGETSYACASISARTASENDSELIFMLDEKPVILDDLYGHAAKVMACEVGDHSQGRTFIAYNNTDEARYSFDLPADVKSFDLVIKIGDTTVKLNDEPLHGRFSLVEQFYHVWYSLDSKNTESTVVQAGKSVTITRADPVKKGLTFEGWLHDGNLFHRGDQVIDHISKPETIVAKFSARDVFFNIVVRHRGMLDGRYIHNTSEDRKDITFIFPNGSKQETRQLSESSHDGFRLSDHPAQSVYYGTEPLFKEGELDPERFAASKPGYKYLPMGVDEVIGGDGELEGDEVSGVVTELEGDEESRDDGRLTYVIYLAYNPVKLEFTVKLDESLMALPEDERPTSVNVQVSENNGDAWILIGNEVTVPIDPASGLGKGHAIIAVGGSVTDYYRIAVKSMNLPSGQMQFVDVPNHESEKYESESGKYTGVVTVEGGGQPKDESQNGTKLSGVYFAAGDKNIWHQHGTIQAELSLTQYSVTLDPLADGVIPGMKKGESKVYSNVFAMPDVSADKPTIDTGKVFSHWVATDDRGKQIDVPKAGDALFSNVKLIAVYKDVPRHSVTYQYTNTPEGAPAPPASASYVEGQRVTVAKSPSMEGYTFSGWSSTDVDVSEGFFAMPQSDVAISGSWKRQQRLVAFDGNGHGGRVPSAQTVNYGDSATRPADMVDEHWTFLGWSTERDGSSGLYDFATPVKNNMVLYAQWKIKSYAVTFDVDGGTPEVPSQMVEYGGHATHPGDVTKEGHTFVGWYTTGSNPQRWDFDNSVILGDVALKARWVMTPTVAIHYKTQYFAQALDGSYSLLTTFDAVGVNDQVVTAEPMILTGFRCNLAAPGTVAEGTLKQGEGLVLKLYYDRNSYTVSYAYNNVPDGVPSVPEAKTYRYGDNVKVEKFPALEGWNFAGWYTADVKVEDGAFVVPAWDVVLTGTWIPAEYTVSFDVDGGMPEIDSQTVPYGQTLYDPGKVAKQGYDFAGWYTDGDDPKLWDFAADTVSGDMTLKAHWRASASTEYTIEHYTQDLDATARAATFSLAKTVKATGTTGEVVAAETVALEGFTLNPDAPGTVSSGVIKPDGTLVLKLFYDRDSHEVTYEYINTPEGAPDLPPTATYKFGQRVTVAENPVMQGYSFTGWKSDGVDVTTGSFDMPAGSVKIIGGWQRQLRMVAFDGNGHGGVVPEPATVYYGEPVAKPADMADEHWTFLGWSTTRDGASGLYDFAAPVTSNFVLYAQWKVNSYTVTFDTDGGAPAVPDQVVEYGQHATAPGAISKEGYTFVGWYTVGDSPQRWSFEHSVVAGNTALKARWLPTPVVPVHYQTEYYVEGLDGGYSLLTSFDAVGENGQKVTADPMILTGFHCNLDAPGTVAEGTLKQGEGLVLKLYYDRSSFAVAYSYYNTPEGADPVPAPTSYAFGQTVAIEKAPAELDGWTFTGWYTADAEVSEGSFTMPAWDVDVVGGWIPKVFTITWKNYDGTVLFVDKEAPYGVDPCYAGEIPTKPADEEFTYVFDGWTPSLAPVTADATYTAKFKAVPIPETYTVTFDVQGHGTAPEKQLVLSGSKVVKPGDPEAEGFTFDGWFTDKDCTVAYDFDAAVTGDMTLYAKWTKKVVPPGPTPDPTPKRPSATGDALAVMPLGAIALAAMGILVVARRRKKS